MELKTENVHALLEYWAGVKLVLAPDVNFLKAMRTLSSLQKYLAAQSMWFEELVTESVRVVEDCYTG